MNNEQSIQIRSGQVFFDNWKTANERSIEMNRPGEFKVLLVAKAVSDYLRSDGLPSENDLNIWETLLDQAVAEIRDEHRTSEGK